MISPDGCNAAAAEHGSHSCHPTAVTALAGRRGGRRATGEGIMTGVAAGALADVLRVGYSVVYSAEIAGNRQARANFLTTFTEADLVWGSSQRPLITSSELPHHLYRKRARGEARVNFLTTYIEECLAGKLLPHYLYRRVSRGKVGYCLTTYTEEWLVGKLVTSSPPIQKTGSWGSYCITIYTKEGLVGKLLPHHLWRRRVRGEVSYTPADCLL